MTAWSRDTWKTFALVTITMLIMVSLCIWFIDQPIALYVHNNHPLHALIHTLLGTITGSANANNHIPDFLMPMTVIITILSWVGYWIRTYYGHFDRHTYFFKMAGVTVPLAFLSKSITKFVFGRINTRVWVVDPTQSRNFHWLEGLGNYHGFPSGHMAVLTPVFIALWHFYPGLRILWMTALLSLASALVLTDYHFVSDVIAGAYLGLLIYCLCLNFLVPGSSSCLNAIWNKSSFTNR